jgi:hypothetical protein
MANLSSSCGTRGKGAPSSLASFVSFNSTKLLLWLNRYFAFGRNIAPKLKNKPLFERMWVVGYAHRNIIEPEMMGYARSPVGFEAYARQCTLQPNRPH